MEDINITARLSLRECRSSLITLLMPHLLNYCYKIEERPHKLYKIKHLSFLQ